MQDFAAPAPAALMPPVKLPPDIDKVVVAVHGIGNQRRSATIRAVVNRFGDRVNPPLPLQPLGFFHIGDDADVLFSRLPSECPALRRIGFVEVFWADIPRGVAEAQDTLEEAKAWARTVASRAHALYNEKVKPGDKAARHLDHHDFEMAAGVLAEVVETVDVIERLTGVARAAGVFSFDFAALLRDYVGDVQIVTEFEYYRRRILWRFHHTMQQLSDQFRRAGRPVEIHIVAHSEGSVIGFLALLQALAGETIVPPGPRPPAPGEQAPARATDPPATAAALQPLPAAADAVVPPDALALDWIRDVRGFMTLGSPIDKHIVLWPGLWKGLRLECQRDAQGRVALAQRRRDASLVLPRPIEWRNYYDLGDPIGFKLDSARRWLEQEQRCQAFAFGPEQDIGFSRYPLPGKAHNDYWDDPEVFGHFIDNVVLRPDGAAAAVQADEAPPPRAGKAPVADPTPAPGDRPAARLCSTALPYAVSALLHGAAAYVALKALSQLAQVGAGEGLDALQAFAVRVAMLAAYLAGVTVASRLPRLVGVRDGRGRLWRWHAVALAAFAAGAYFYIRYWAWPSPRLMAVAACGALLCVGCWVLSRQPSRARKLMIVVGAAVFLGAFALQLQRHPPDDDMGLWLVLLGGAAFLYLWWLGILLFDLAFVWHRYVRNSVAVDNLNAWYERREAEPRPLLGKDAGTDRQPPPAGTRAA